MILYANIQHKVSENHLLHVVLRKLLLLLKLFLFKKKDFALNYFLY